MSKFLKKIEKKKSKFINYKKIVEHLWGELDTPQNTGPKFFCDVN